MFSRKQKYIEYNMADFQIVISDKIWNKFKAKTQWHNNLFYRKHFLPGRLTDTER